MGTNYNPPDWNPSLTEIYVKENLGSPDWSPTPVKMEDGKLNMKKGSTSATDTEFLTQLVGG